jgi:hypothetical protein
LKLLRDIEIVPVLKVVNPMGSLFTYIIVCRKNPFQFPLEKYYKETSPKGCVLGSPLSVMVG